MGYNVCIVVECGEFIGGDLVFGLFLSSAEKCLSENINIH